MINANNYDNIFFSGMKSQKICIRIHVYTKLLLNNNLTVSKMRRK